MLARNRIRVALAGVVVAAVLVPTAIALAATNPSNRAVAQMMDTNGRTLGSVSFQVVDGKMQVTTRVKLPPQFAGFHGFHLHRVGTCDTNAVDPGTGQRSPFFSAGGHIGSEDGHSHAGHDGDLPSLLVNRDGWAVSSVLTDHVSWDRIFDADGTAVMIHLGADNFANIPTRYSATGPDPATLASGDSGGRTVCGRVLRD